eukprot:13544278-Ditylum_brightwellii.AAC.1
MAVIYSTWAFKVKRFPDGSFKKYKAYLCMRGDQQRKDVNYFETFSPVVSWSTVRIVMTVALHLGLKSKQVDYANAFVQTDLTKGEEVYMTFPCDWEESCK